MERTSLLIAFSDYDKKGEKKMYKDLDAPNGLILDLGPQDEPSKNLTVLDDIDAPILKCVKMFTLLGCKTVWSCCGFNYEGQPKWKSHTYNCPYVRMNADAKTFKLMYKIVDDLVFAHTNQWYITLASKPQQKPQFGIGCNFNGTKDWTDKDCPHMHERCVSAIDLLEKKLLSFKDQFKEKVILRDSNTDMTKQLEYWQFKGKAPIEVLKSEFM